jgi:hypothetical protein
MPEPNQRAVPPLSRKVWSRLGDLLKPGFYGRLTLAIKDGRVMMHETSVVEDANDR